MKTGGAMLLVAVGLLALWIVVTGRLTQLQTAWTYLQSGPAGVASLSSANAGSGGSGLTGLGNAVGGAAGTIGSTIGNVVGGYLFPSSKSLTVPSFPLG